MGLGVQEPRGKRDTVTGTIIMTKSPSEQVSPDTKIDNNEYDDDENDIIMINGTRPRLSSVTLKTTRDGIILNPQPQDNPNDPLNMPLWRRDMALLVIGFHSFIGGGQTPLLAAGLSGLSEEFHKSPTTILYLVGGFMLLLGFGSLFASPTAILYGKRIVYLVGCLIALGGAIWGACAQSFGSLMGARVLVGIGMSPTESLPSATILEIYFAHERAYRLGIYTFLLLGGKNLVPLLSGFVFQNLGRKWVFWVLTIVLGVNFGLMFFFAPETFWNRTPVPPDKRSQEETAAAREYKLAHVNSNDSQRSVPNSFAIRNLGHHSDEEQSHHRSSRSHYNDDRSIVETLNSSILNQELIISLPEPITDEQKLEVPNEPIIKRKPYVQTLKVTSGRHTKDKWWMVFLRPIVLCFYPPIAFGSLMYTFAIVWLIMISEAMSHIFTRLPYGYDPAIAGLFYVSPFIGSTLGSVIAGRLSDIMVRRLVERNNGTYEPEFRLIMVIPVFLSVTIGLMGFGWSIQNADLWIVPIVFFGIIGFGCSLLSTTLITYTVDSYKMFATELLVTLNVAKNVVGFLFSLFNNSFIDNHGARTAYLTYGGIQIFVCLLAIPMYIYGKRLRAWTDDKEMIRFLYVDGEHTSHVDSDDSAGTVYSEK